VHWAAEFGFTDVCQILIDAGANIDETAGTATALHLAAMARQAAVCTLLVSRGSNTRAMYKNATPAALAKRYGHPELSHQIRSMEKSKKALDAVNGMLKSIHKELN
jgi:ankyrin repeat protein